MTSFEAPAKVNLSLLVSPPRRDGLHPIESLAQTIDWCDLLGVDPGEGRDRLESDIEDNLVLRALAVAREFGSVPYLDLRLEKSIPVAAGMGGGSSDAAAALLAAASLGDVPRSELSNAASRIGADVAFFLTGGLAMMSGIGDRISEVQPIDGFALGVVVPTFGLSTPEVYRRWDELEGPTARPVDPALLPPSLRDTMPIRNDLLPAALDLEPTFGDFMADVGAIWGSTVCMTGSGSACFGFFPTVDEATDAATAVAHLTREGRGVALRPKGVSRVE